MEDTRHQTVINITDGLFSNKFTCLIMEDMLSNHMHEHGDEDFLDSEFLNELSKVAYELTKTSEKLREIIADSHDYVGYNAKRKNNKSVENTVENDIEIKIGSVVRVHASNKYNLNDQFTDGIVEWKHLNSNTYWVQPVKPDTEFISDWNILVGNYYAPSKMGLSPKRGGK